MTVKGQQIRTAAGHGRQMAFHGARVATLDGAGKRGDGAVRFDVAQSSGDQRPEGPYGLLTGEAERPADAPDGVDQRHEVVGGDAGCRVIERLVAVGDIDREAPEGGDQGRRLFLQPVLDGHTERASGKGTEGGVDIRKTLERVNAPRDGAAPARGGQQIEAAGAAQVKDALAAADSARVGQTAANLLNAVVGR